MFVLPPPTRDTILEIARRLPPAATILTSVCELLHDINTDLDQLADQIRLDAVLAARVVRVANSVVYGGRGSVSSVEDALGRVGFSEVVRLVGTASVSRIVERDLNCYHLKSAVLRESLLMHGIASEVLAEMTGVDRNAAYVAGLMRGIGPMVLDRYAADKMDVTLTYDPGTFETYREWEDARFSITGVRATTMALDDWRFPDDTVRAIDSHLDAPQGEDEVDRFACLLNVAGAIAVDNGTALPGEVRYWTVSPEKLALLNLTDDHYSDAVRHAADRFAQQKQAL
ncbi:HDOD domain-containing protein [Opitutus sp. ER46]|uniref:HDOD domain-containing protein n=1 Tax=Opitutus sp. ER46 TaxID=2161864 RepID=UPI000D317CC7|nr:HDOD domain-containing protein [Opitutus sp. ER46]PTX92377.1 hypothetical protein DB354_13645 [Opitutus sp. ER46]